MTRATKSRIRKGKLANGSVFRYVRVPMRPRPAAKKPARRATRKSA